MCCFACNVVEARVVKVVDLIFPVAAGALIAAKVVAIVVKMLGDIYYGSHKQTN